jgi:signal transduction histidine kinase
VYISQPSFDRSAGVLAVLVALPVRIEGDGEVIGVLRSTLSMNKLSSVVRPIGPGTSGWATIVDEAGKELGHGAAPFRLDSAVPSHARPELASSVLDPVSAVGAAADGFGRQSVLGRSRIEVGWGSPDKRLFENEVRNAVAALHWTVIVWQSEEEVDAGLIAAMKRSLVIGILAVVLASMLAIVVATLMTRRIAALKTAVRAIGRGELDTPIPRLGADDIGVLASAFGQMTVRLRQVIQSLQWQAHDASVANEQMRREIELRKSAERALTDASIKADAANRAKSHFLANMSHELRTPLNAVIGFSDILSTEMLGPLGNAKYKEYAEDIRDSGHHLLQLINDVLDLSKIEAGKMELHEEWLDVRDVIEAARTMVAERGARLQSRVEIDVPGTLPRLFADRRLMLQVVLNLLSNSVKFTPEGGRISIAASRADDGGMAIEVTDTGIGIAEADIPTVLQPFGQVEDTFQRKHQGTGLGLPLAVSILEQHGSRLEIQSRLGEGTSITIHWPASRTGSHLMTPEPLADLARESGER